MITARTQVKYDAVLNLSEAELRALAFLSEYHAEDVAKLLGESISMEFRRGGEHHGGILSLLSRARAPAKAQVGALNAAKAAFDHYMQTHQPAEVKP